MILAPAAPPEFLEANLRALLRRAPDVWGIARQEPSNPGIAVIHAESGVPNLLRQEGDRWLSWYDLNDPLAGVERDVTVGSIQGNRLVFLLGLGLGYELAHLIENVSKEAPLSQIVVYEPNPDVWRHAVRQSDLSALFSNPHVWLICQQPGARLDLELEQLFVKPEISPLLRSMGPVTTAGAEAFSGPVLLEAVGHVKRLGLLTVRRQGIGPRVMCEEMAAALINIPRVLVHPHLPEFAGMFAGKTAIVCSAGPSLQQHLETLRTVQDKVVIVCADGALAALRRNGIRPHLVCALDGSPLIQHHLDGMGDEELPLVCYPIMDPDNIRVYGGPIVCAYRIGDYFNALGFNLPAVDLGSSSGNMSYRVARTLGCEKVILLGQDLAFGPDGASHATSTRHRERGLVEGVPQKPIEVPGNAGGMVKTAFAWHWYIKEYERWLSMEPPSVRVINPSNTGAKLNGAEFLSFPEAIEQLLGESFDARAMINERMKRKPVEAAREQVELLKRRGRQALRSLTFVGGRLDRDMEFLRVTAKRWNDAHWAGVACNADAVLKTEDFRRIEGRRRAVFDGIGSDAVVLYLQVAQSVMAAFNLYLVASETDCTTTPQLARAMLAEYARLLATNQKIIESIRGILEIWIEGFEGYVAGDDQPLAIPDYDERIDALVDQLPGHKRHYAKTAAPLPSGSKPRKGTYTVVDNTRAVGNDRAPPPAEIPPAAAAPTPSPVSEQK